MTKNPWYKHKPIQFSYSIRKMLGGNQMDTNWDEMNVEAMGEMAFPLPLETDDLEIEDKNDVSVEVRKEEVRKLYPQINMVPNIAATLIPIITGITLYSYIRFFDAYPSAQAVDIYVNGRLTAENVLYREFTKYWKTFPGYYRIQVYRVGDRRRALLDKYINLIGYRVYTVALSGIDNRVDIELINDFLRPIPKQQALMRIAGLSANAPSMDAYWDDQLVLSDINYPEISRYLNTGIGRHNLKMRDWVSGAVLVEEPDIRLTGGNAYTAYVIGDMNDRTGLQIIVTREGISYLNF